MQNSNQAKFTVSIGIPAYNEEANIGYLLNDLLTQKEEGYRLEKIYVYSDGSTDTTEGVVRDVLDGRIELIIGRERMGASHGQNTIMAKALSEALVFLNADIQIRDKDSIQKLIKPLMNKEADLVSVKHKPLPARNFFESILVTSVELKSILFETYNKGNNVYTCHGSARAFSKKLYKEMTFRKSVGEDAYSYLYCVFHGYKYNYVQDTEIYYRLPNSFTDHKSQSTRFFKGKSNFGDVFGEGLVYQTMRIPQVSYLLASMKAIPLILRKPITVGGYIFLVCWLRMQAFFGGAVSETWEIATSSKKLR